MVRRVIIVNNPLSAFFMIASLDEKSDNSNTLVFFEPRRYKNNENKKKVTQSELLTKHAFKKRGFKIHVLPEISYYHYDTLTHIIKYPLILLRTIANYKTIRKSNEYRILNNAKEIWYSNTNWQKYINKNNVKVIRYDHGISDIYTYFNQKYRIQKALYSLYANINIINEYEYRNHMHASLMSDVINNIHSTTLLDVGNDYPKERLRDNIGDNIAIVLTDSVNGLTDSKNIRKYYLDAFIAVLENEIYNLLKIYNIDSIVLKPKYQHADDISYILNNLQVDEVNIYNINDIGINTSLEYYVNDKRIKAIVANLGSAIIYSKQIRPKIITISYHEWFKQFTLKNIGKTLKDQLINAEILESNEQFVKYFPNHII